MKEFIIKNIGWIVLFIVILIGSNILTGMKVSSLSRKEKRLLKERGDSIDRVVLRVLVEKEQEAQLRKADLRQYNTVITKFQADQARDKVLINYLALEVNKIKKLNSHDLVLYADSVFAAHH